MSVYAIVQLTITDRATYTRYQERFMSLMNRHKVQLLAFDEQPRVIEGAWEHEKVVLLSFPDAAAFWELANSPDYQEIVKDRRAGSTAVVLLVEGIPAEVKK